MKIIGQAGFGIDHHVAARAAADVIAVLAAFVLVAVIFGGWAGGWTEFLLYALLMAGIVVAAYSRFGLYRSRITVLNLLDHNPRGAQASYGFVTGDDATAAAADPEDHAVQQFAGELRSAPPDELQPGYTVIEPGEPGYVPYVR